MENTQREDNKLETDITNSNSEPKEIKTDEKLQKLSWQDIKPLLVVYVLFFLILALFLPKIYIANNIYFLSRKIEKIKMDVLVLEQQNIELLTKLQKKTDLEN